MAGKKLVEIVALAVLTMGIGTAETEAPEINQAVTSEKTTAEEESSKPKTIKWGRVYSVDEEEISYLVTNSKGNTYSQTLYFELCNVHYVLEGDKEEKFHWARMVMPGCQLIKKNSTVKCGYVPLADGFISYHDLVSQYGVEGVEHQTQKGGLIVDGIMLLGISE